MSELAQVCARLSQENAELREQMSRMTAPQAATALAIPESRRPLDAAALSRRSIGKALGAAAAGVVGAAAFVELAPRSSGSAPAGAALAADEVGAGQSDAGVAPAATASPSVVNATINSASGVVVTSNSGSGPGIKATGAKGRGGIFAGSLAQVQLSPGSKSTHPTSGNRGDLYADSTGRLWYCKKTGTNATWHQIA